MSKTLLFNSLKLFLFCTVSVRAFSPAARSDHGQRALRESALRSVPPSKDFCGRGGSAKTTQQQQQHQQQRREFVATLGAFVAGSVVSGAKPAHADDIKTLDMSLPSYDKASSLKADAQALGVEEPVEPVKKKAAAPKKKKGEAGSSGGGGMLGNVLPSMNKSGPTAKKGAKPKEDKPKKAKPEPAPKVEYETMEFGLPSYSESTEKKGKSAFAL